MQRRALLLSVALNLAFLAATLHLVRIKGGFDYLWTKTSSMIREMGFKREYNPHYFHRKELFEQMPVRADDVLFFGDSLVEHCEWAELLDDPTIRNRGILGDDVIGVLHRVEQDLKPVPPRMIYLVMGINDLFRYVPQNRILANYEDVLERINVLAPDCKVLAHGLLPIDERIAPQPIASATIRSLNAGLKKLCRKRGITYIDTFDTFDQDGDGRLDESYSRDGLHLNAKGYFAWKKLLEIQGHATK
jgi:lysophospholipase L1-like esterase